MRTLESFYFIRKNNGKSKNVEVGGKKMNQGVEQTMMELIALQKGENQQRKIVIKQLKKKPKN